ncbi:MAG: sel1 repeat family protein [Hyphomicrobiales bacterium]|nr:sel1 repeat family protein [Hyphomicrobiales bacterium]
MFKQLLAGFVSIVVLGGAAMAGPFEDGLAAYRSGDYATALKLWRPLAEQGNASAQFNLGLMYGKGESVPQDYARAAKWFGRAAEQDDARAQTNLGLIYANGEGVPEDYAKAAKWFRLAAEQGDARAQANLGLIYDHGDGVPQDYAEAVRWYRLAAEQGDPDAQLRLGVMYNKGEGVPQDFAAALELLQPLAEQGHADARNTIGVSYANGEGVPQDVVLAHKWFSLSATQGLKDARKNLKRLEREMTPGQLAEAHRTALELWLPLAEQGDARAQFRLGVIYAAAKGGLQCDPQSCVPQDIVQAHMWWNLASAQGLKDARKSRDRIAKKMTPDQITEAQRMAREWKPKAGQ